MSKDFKRKLFSDSTLNLNIVHSTSLEQIEKQNQRAVFHNVQFEAGTLTCAQI